MVTIGCAACRGDGSDRRYRPKSRAQCRCNDAFWCLPGRWLANISCDCVARSNQPALCHAQTGNATLTVLTSPPTNNQTLLQIIAGEDVIRIEQLIAVFSPAAARVFYERY